MCSNLVYIFAPFRLNPSGRLLTADDMPLKLGGRAFDTLLALVERRERVVTKNELLDIVWPKLVVEENNLQVQVVALRKLLGHHAVATIPGRGYRFTMPVVVEGEAPPAAPPAVGGELPPPPLAAATTAPAAPRPVFNLPRRAEPLFGRDADVAALCAALRESRVVTIAGAGGIGKTRAAEAAALVAHDDFADGIWWVELASIADPELVPGAVARALGLPMQSAPKDTLHSIVARVGEQSMLVVIDNCEHLLGGVAAFIDTVIAATPRLHVLVTSQELIKTGSERVYRLGTLSVAAAETAAAVAESGAGALLVARARAAAPGFGLSDANAGAAAEICRRLDGIPLAIELAAARVPLLGIEGVRAKLGERFRMLTAGARVVLRRHQTLRAALEWSHSLLTEEERIVLRRLGVFAGGFTLESAQRVADDEAIDAWDVLEHLGALVDKSLVLAEGEPMPRYRLLETTRMYALEQLAAAGETERATRKHAVAIKTLLAAFDSPAKRWRTTPADWAAAAVELDNTRVALEWAERQDEDGVLRLELAAVAGMAFWWADAFGEGFRRLLAMARHVDPGLPVETRAGFLLMLARIGTQMAHTESFDAALQAAELLATLGEDARRYVALTSAIAIAARADTGADVEGLIAQAEALEPPWSPRPRGNFEWARHRWLLREGRPQEALVHAWRQVELTLESGAEGVAELIKGSNVAYCELALGHADVALALARGAMATTAGSDLGCGHVLDTLMMSLAVQGEFDEALRIAHRAYADFRVSGDEFMLLDGLAWVAAALGRLRDAVIVMAHSDQELAARRFLRWPLSREWRRRTEALLADVSPAQLERWRHEGAQTPSSAVFEHGLGLRVT